MSRLIQPEQYDHLMALRSVCIKSIQSGNDLETQRGIGMVQGFLQGLQLSGEIDQNDVKALEDDTFASVNFMLNLRAAGRLSRGRLPS